MTTYDILYKGFKKWYGVFVAIQIKYIGTAYINFNGFWEDIQELRMDGLVIDTEPPKIVGLAGLEGITYSKWEVLEKLENKTFSDEYRYFTLSTSQYDEMFLLYGYKTKKEALENLKKLNSSGEFFISVYFKA